MQLSIMRTPPKKNDEKVKREVDQSEQPSSTHPHHHSHHPHRSTTTGANAAENGESTRRNDAAGNQQSEHHAQSSSHSPHHHSHHPHKSTTPVNAVENDKSTKKNDEREKREAEQQVQPSSTWPHHHSHHPHRSTTTGANEVEQHHQPGKKNEAPVPHYQPKPDWFSPALVYRLRRTVLVVKDVPAHLTEKQFEAYRVVVPNHESERMYVKVVPYNNNNAAGERHRRELHLSFWEQDPNLVGRPLLGGRPEHPSRETYNEEISFQELERSLDKTRKPREDAAAGNGGNENKNENKNNNGNDVKPNHNNNDKPKHDLVEFVAVACTKLVGRVAYNPQNRHKRNDEDQPNNDVHANDDGKSYGHPNEKERSKRAVFFPVRPIYGGAYIGVRPVVSGIGYGAVYPGAVYPGAVVGGYPGAVVFHGHHRFGRDTLREERIDE